MFYYLLFSSFILQRNNAERGVETLQIELNGTKREAKENEEKWSTKINNLSTDR